MSEDELEDNPLFSVCTCAGSMKLIHLKCIRTWLEGKVHKKHSELVFSYNWKNLECELCKTRFRDTHWHEGKQYNILNYHRPEEGAYIILESFTNTPHKTIHVISIDKVKMKQKAAFSFLVGRENTVDIRITDISVSRAHSYINYYNGNFYVADNKSKFGTLVLVQQPFPISYNPNITFTVQLGRYLVSAAPVYQGGGYCCKKKLELLHLPHNKTFNDYINNYPYMLSIKLGVINKSSIKSFRDANGHEMLNEKHKLTSKRKNRISPLADILEDKPKKELYLQKSMSLEFTEKPNHMDTQKTVREEFKSPDPVDDYRTNEIPSENRMIGSIYASTDLRTSIDPHGPLTRRTNNYMSEEHISITHRLRGPSHNTTNNETVTLSGTLQGNTRGVVLDPEMYRVNGPKPNTLSLDPEESLGNTLGYDTKLPSPNVHTLGKHMNSREIVVERKVFQKPYPESLFARSNFEVVKESNEEEVENLKEFLNNSTNSGKKLKDEVKEESKYGYQMDVEDKSDEEDKENYRKAGKLTSLSYYGPIATKDMQGNQDLVPAQNLMTIKLKNNFFNRSTDSEQDQFSLEKIQKLREKSNNTSMQMRKSPRLDADLPASSIRLKASEPNDKEL